jgi:hypothetical protein
MNKMLQWLQQPTSVAGISTIIGTVSAVALHQIDAVQAAPLLAAAVVSIVLPDNTAARSAAELLARDLVSKNIKPQEKT